MVDITVSGLSTAVAADVSSQSRLIINVLDNGSYSTKGIELGVLVCALPVSSVPASKVSGLSASHTHETEQITSVEFGNILGRISGGVGVAEKRRISAFMDAGIGVTAGALVYRTSTSYAQLGQGSVGDFLQSNGVSAPPSWATPGTAIFSDATDFGTASQVGDHENRITILEAAGGADTIERIIVSNPASPWTPTSIIGNARIDVLALDHALTINTANVSGQVNNVEGTVELRLTAAGSAVSVSFASGYTTILGSLPIMVVPASATRSYFIQCVDATNWSLLGDQVASESERGLVRLAQTSTINAGANATDPICPDQFAGSNFGVRGVTLVPFGPTTSVSVGDGKAYWTVPVELSGMNLFRAKGVFVSAGVSGTALIQVARIRTSIVSDMLSTRINIETNEIDSDDATTQPVIDTSVDDVIARDRIRIDVDAIQTETAPKGLEVQLAFKLP